jgi:hypothetical protein
MSPELKPPVEDTPVDDPSVRVRKVARWTLASLFFGIPIALAILYYWAVAEMEASVEAEFARIRAEGFPVTRAELSKWPKIQPEDNAAPIYKEAFSAMVPYFEFKHLPFAGIDAKELLPGAPLPRVMLKEMEEFLKKTLLQSANCWKQPSMANASFLSSWRRISVVLTGGQFGKRDLFWQLLLCNMHMSAMVRPLRRRSVR